MIFSLLDAGHTVFDVYASVDLATGGAAESDLVGIEHLPMWKDDGVVDEIVAFREEYHRHAANSTTAP